MVTALYTTDCEEFLKGILAGKRDFSGIRLEEETILDQTPFFREMQEYIMAQGDLKENPVVIDGSELRYLQAVGLCLPFVRGRMASLTEADLSESNLYGADLSKSSIHKATLCRANLDSARLDMADLSEANLYRANLRKANLNEADLTEADLTEACLARATLERAILGQAKLNGAELWRANLMGANLYGADFDGANLDGANLSRADIRNARNLESALSLGNARLNGTLVTKTEKEIIERLYGSELCSRLYVTR